MGRYNVESFPRTAKASMRALISLQFHHQRSSTQRFGSYHTVRDLDCSVTVALCLRCLRTLHHSSSIETFLSQNPHVSVFILLCYPCLSPSVSPHLCSQQRELFLSSKWRRSERQPGFCCLHKLSVARALCIPRPK